VIDLEIKRRWLKSNTDPSTVDALFINDAKLVMLAQTNLISV
jgi:hypothetical protein